MVFISTYIIVITDNDYIDRGVYSTRFIEIQNSTLLDSINSIGWEPFFVALMKLISLFTSNLTIFYIALHLIFLFILLSGLKKIFDDNKIRVIVFFVYLNYTFYFGYTLNGLRQGIAMTLIVLAIGYAIENKKLKMIFVSIVSIFFHYTIIPVAIMVVLTYYWKRMKISYLTFIYVLLTFFYVTGLNQYIFGSLPVGDFESYLQEDSIQDFGGANKLSYLLFNTSWLLFFLFIFRNHSRDKIYAFLIKVYILTSIYLLSFGFIAFANRIASYSWFIIPLLLGYLIYKSKNSILNISILILIFIAGFITGIPNYILE